MKKTSFVIKTFGCKVNQYESQSIRESLLAAGYTELSMQDASVIIVNSCTVTGQADIKTRRCIRRAKKENPGASIIVTGCYAVEDDDIALLNEMPEISVVVTNDKKSRIPSIVRELNDDGPADLATEERVSGLCRHSRAFVKIQDGCDQNCSYCKVSLVRGPSVSRPAGKILEEISRVYANGYREIVLTGICLGAWRDGSRDLPFLLKDIQRVQGDFRIRLSSIEPNFITGELVNTIKSLENVCRHFHIPLQSGSDRVLSKMKRRYNINMFDNIIDKIREKLPLSGITMDVITGFPGETEEDHFLTLEYIKKVRPSRLHVFGYSDRKGTVSFEMKDKVPQEVIKKRVEELMKTGQMLGNEFARCFIGREIEVLAERDMKKDVMHGYSGEYVPVKFEDPYRSAGDIVKAVPYDIDESSGYLVAKVHQKNP